jgi:hypothetical protein
VIVDAAGEFRATYAATGGSGCLVRPDGYLGFRAAPITTTALQGHLEAGVRHPNPRTRGDGMTSARRAAATATA